VWLKRRDKIMVLSHWRKEKTPKTSDNNVGKKTEENNTETKQKAKQKQQDPGAFLVPALALFSDVAISWTERGSELEELGKGLDHQHLSRAVLFLYFKPRIMCLSITTGLSQNKSKENKKPQHCTDSGCRKWRFFFLWQFYSNYFWLHGTEISRS
jgi:hypothetical protein